LTWQLDELAEAKGFAPKDAYIDAELYVEAPSSSTKEGTRSCAFGLHNRRSVRYVDSYQRS
jgi:hypothetical protein